MKLERILSLPDLAQLLAESQSEGFRFIDRLIEDFESGDNRFDQPGEALFATFDAERCIAIGGLNLDPNGEPGVGRVRRFYVTQSYRGCGVGRQLIGRIEHWAGGHFSSLQLFTDTTEASAFYEALGYHPIDEAQASHVKVLKPRE